MPDSLCTLLNWILLGDLDTDSEIGEFQEEQTELNTELMRQVSDENHNHQKILNLGQDIFYALSKGRKNTPKHIATGLLVHNTTCSKFLVEYLRSCGSSIGYDTVQRIDTSIAQAQIDRFVANDNVFIPENLKNETFLQFSADNFDVIQETFDGKEIFHVTEMAAFQKVPKVKNQC